jgi:hypothetical protein
VQVIQDGRPKASQPETGSNGEPFDFFLAFTRFSRICGRIAKSLYSAVGLSCNSMELLGDATELSAAFTEWRESIPATFRPGTPFRPSTISNEVSLTQALVINLGYNYGLCAIYRRFTAHYFQRDPPLSTSNVSNVESTTSAMCVEAARSMILLTKYVDVESYTPAWYVSRLKLNFQPDALQCLLFVANEMSKAHLLLSADGPHLPVHLCHLQPDGRVRE